MDPDEITPSLIDTASGLPDEGSLLDRLVQTRDETAEDTTVDVKIPGYSSPDITLYARYRLLTGKEVDIRAKAVSREFKNNSDRQLYGNIDLMLLACEGFYVDAGEGKQPLTYQGEHVSGYNQALAEALKLKVDPNHPARSIVFALFKNNDIAIGTHGMRLSMWMSDTSIDVDQALLGNP